MVTEAEAVVVGWGRRSRLIWSRIKAALCDKSNPNLASSCCTTPFNEVTALGSACRSTVSTPFAISWSVTMACLSSLSSQILLTEKTDTNGNSLFLSRNLSLSLSRKLLCLFLCLLSLYLSLYNFQKDGNDLSVFKLEMTVCPGERRV